MKQVQTRSSRIALTILGFLFTGLAILGVFLPVLPTTVWLLLAASCWMRSSTRFYHWLIRNRYLGNYLRNYREHRGITRRHKIFTLTLLWVGISVSALILVSRVWLSLLLYGVAVAVTIHILTLKTLTNNGAKPAIRATSPENDD
jgi:uncharacterized protein